MSESEDKLVWDLPRFLELASQQGHRVLLVIDGVGRLRSDDGGAKLNWLPLRFPGNCRVVLTATDMRDGLAEASSMLPSSADDQSIGAESLPNGGAGSGAASVGTEMTLEVQDQTSLDQQLRVRIVKELIRRNWRIVLMPPSLTPAASNDLVAKFLTMAAQADLSEAMSTTFQLTQEGADSEGSEQPLIPEDTEELPGLCMFPSHVEALLSPTGNPLYVSLMLRCLRYSAAKGFDLHALLGAWPQAASVKELVVKVLDTWENGQQAPSPSRADSCLELAQGLGGFPALRASHPLFLKVPAVGSNVNAQALSSSGVEGSSAAGPSSGGLAPLGEDEDEERWEQQQSAADALFDAAQARAEASASALLAAADAQASNGSKPSDSGKDESALPPAAAPTPPGFVLGARVEALFGGGDEWFTGKVSKVHGDGRYDIEYDDGDFEARVESSLMKAEGGPSQAESGYGSDEYSDEEEEQDADEKDERVIEEVPREEDPPANEPAKEDSKGEDNSNKDDDDDKDDEYGDDFDADDYGDDFEDDEKESSQTSEASPHKSGEKVPTPKKTSPLPARPKLVSQNSMVSEADLKKMQQELETRRRADSTRRATEANDALMKEAARAAQQAIEEEERVAAAAAEVAATKHLVPLSYRGGEHVHGTGTLLGYALALLYVARHGLKEHELWAMLFDLREDDEAAKKRGISAQDEAEAEFLGLVMSNRPQLMTIFRGMDLNHDGTLSMHEFRRGLRHLNVGMHDMQIELIVKRVVEATKDDNNYSGTLKYSMLFKVFESRLAEIEAAREAATANAAAASGASGKQQPLDDTAAALDAILNDDGGGGASMNSNGGTLEPDLEATLLAQLTALGVMRYPSEGVLVLPTQCDALRDVVYVRYVGSDAKKEAWHLRLVKYFSRHSPSLRRCEELPWHLQRVRRWVQLNATLADLRTFELMFEHPMLKAELLQYWRLLSMGPLFLTDALETQRRKAEAAALETLKNSKDKVASVLPYEASVRLEELDKQAVLGLTETRTKMHRLEGQVAPFDCVVEYNKTVEAWAVEKRPTTHRLAAILYKVGAFLVDLSEVLAAAIHSQEGLLHETIHPPLLRKPLDYYGSAATEPGLCTIGIEPYVFDIPKAFAGTSNHPKAQAGDEDSNQGKDKVAPKTGLTSPLKSAQAAGEAVLAEAAMSNDAGNGGEGSKRAKEYAVSHHYHYDRWLWMQFPWLALANASSFSQQARGDALLSQMAQASKFSALGPTSATHAQTVLRSSSAGAVLTAQDGNGDGPEGGIGGEEAFKLGETNSVVESHSAIAKALEGAMGTERRRWNMKKVNPSLEQAPRPPASVSELQKHSRVSVALEATYNGARDGEFSAGRLARLEQSAYGSAKDAAKGRMEGKLPRRMRAEPVYQSSMHSSSSPSSSPRAAAAVKPQASSLPGGPSTLGPSVASGSNHPTTTATTAKMPKGGIPFSYSSAKAQRAGTRFPSVEKLHVDKIIAKEKSQDSQAAAAVERFGGSYTPRTMAGVLEMKNLDDLQANAPNSVDVGYLPAHIGVFAVKVEETRKADSLARVAKLRRAYDAALDHRHRKLARLEELSLEVAERQEQDAQMAATAAVGEQTMDALELRVRRMAVELKAADALGDFYTKITNMCSDVRNPACEKRRLREMDQQVRLCRTQLAELMHTRQGLYAERDELEKVSGKALKKELRTCKGLRAALKRRLKTMYESIAQMKATRKRLFEDPQNAAAAAVATASAVTSSPNAAKKPEREDTPEGKPNAAKSPGGEPNVTTQRRGSKNASAPVIDANNGDLNWKRAATEATLSKLASLEAALGVKFNATSSIGDDNSNSSNENASFEAQVIEKVRASERLTDQLQDEKGAAEKRLLVLQAELDSCSREYESLQVAGNNPYEGMARDERRLEESLAAAEMASAAASRRATKIRENIQATKTGVQHVARIVIAYQKTGLLPPRVPSMTSNEPLFMLDDAAVERSFDDDAVLDQLLAASEQQISVVKEALSVGKQLDSDGGEKEESNAQRHTGQRELARAIGHGPAAEMLASGQEESELEGIRILTHAEAETKYEEDVSSLQAAQDAAAEEFHSRGKRVVAVRDENSGIKTFLQDALRSSKEATDMQRKVNMMTQAKQGSLAPKGLALEDVLYEKQKPKSPSKAAAAKGSQTKKASSAASKSRNVEADAELVVDRDDLKKSAAGLVARKRAEERRIIKMKEAEERRLMEMVNG